MFPFGSGLFGQRASGPPFRSLGTADAFTASPATPGLPAGWAAGEYAVLLVGATNGASSPAPTINTPAGWTLIGSITGSNTIAGRLSVFGRKLQAGDVAPSITVTDASTEIFAQMATYTGVHASTPTEAPLTADDAGGSPASYLRPTTLGPSRTVVHAFLSLYSAPGTTGTPGAGWTERLDASSNFFSVQLDDYQQTSAGQIPAATHTLSNTSAERNLKVAFALIPAA